MSRSPRSNVRRLALGRLLSVTGGAAAFTALNFTVWDRTHSPFMQALSLLLTFGVAGLIGPFAGALGDRLDRRMVLIWSEAISACSSRRWCSSHSPLVLILLAFASAIAELPFLSASRAAIPNLVDDPGGHLVGEQPRHAGCACGHRDRPGDRWVAAWRSRTSHGCSA